MSKYTLSEIMRVGFGWLSDWFFMVLGNEHKFRLELQKTDYNPDLVEVRLCKPYCPASTTLFPLDEDTQENICKEFELNPNETGWFIHQETFDSLDEMSRIVRDIKLDLKQYASKD